MKNYCDILMPSPLKGRQGNGRGEGGRGRVRRRTCEGKVLGGGNEERVRGAVEGRGASLR